jgi:tRNA G10  N-methylase Trm11
MSVRLAKILINLSGAKPGDTIADPFCGIGVLPQEALMMGIDVKGMDIEPSCVRDSVKNLDWTKKRYNLKGKYEIFIGDSSKDLHKLGKVDALATEPYLGPFMKKIPTKEKALNVMKELRPLYRDFLKGVRKVVKGRSVIIVPRFRLYSGERIKLNFEALARAANMKPIKGFPIIYAAPGSKMDREIWVLE